MFVRVISELKRWSRITGRDTLLPADCFFDIKTSRNTLSLWKVEEQEEGFEQFVVIATLGKSTLSKISYVLISEEELDAQGLQYQQDLPGCQYINEANSDFISHHFDIVNISQEEYIKIANIIMKKIEEEKIEVLSLNEVKKVVKQLSSSGIINEEHLHDSMQKVIANIQ